MSNLYTYPTWRAQAYGITRVDGDVSGQLAPGDAVTLNNRGGQGIVVWVTDDGTGVLWSVMPRTTLEHLKTAMQGMFTQSVVQVQVQVQPMTAPVSGVFYFDYAYPSGSE